MREQLLGYLLSALDPHEMRAIDQRLQSDPQLQAELAQMQRLLSDFDQAVGQQALVDLPAGLTAKTLAQIGQQPPPTLAAAEGTSPPAPVTLADSRRHWFSSAGDQPLPPAGKRSRSDWIVSVVTIASLVALALPMIAGYRSEARKTVCQNNLRQLGMSFSDFVLRRGDTRLPEVAESGREAFSGIYEVRLADAGLMHDPNLRWCPDGQIPTEPCPRARLRGASSLARYIASQPSDQATTSLLGGKLRGNKTVPWQGLNLNGQSSAAAALGEDAWKAVTAHDVIDSKHLLYAALSGDIARLKFLQRLAGGHYAYNLGVYEDGRYRAPKFEARSTFAVLGDAPISGQSLDDGASRRFRWHHGNGANILYEDGSVRFVEPHCMRFQHDHPYLNHDNLVEAGVHVDDAALAPSWYAPTRKALQR